MTSIWDLYREKAGPTDNEFTVIIVGNKESGKTSIVNRFVEKTEATKPTLAMEYLYARRNRTTDSRKDVCHIWELGGGTLFSDLLEIPMNPEKLHSMSVVMILDLSVPEELWIVFDALMTKIRAHLNKVVSLAVNFENTKEPLIEQAWKRLGDHVDKEFISPLPIPMLIIGSKYDLFENMEPESRKIISRTLRFLAHVNGSELIFCSVKSENLVSKSRSALSQLVFHSLSSKLSFITDYMKPVTIPFGGDSLQMIGGVSSPDDYKGKSIERLLDSWRNYFNSHFPQVTKQVSIPDDPGKDPNFQERDIDLIKAEKERELENYRRHHSSRRGSGDFMN